MRYKTRARSSSVLYLIKQGLHASVLNGLKKTSDEFICEVILEINVF